MLTTTLKEIREHAPCVDGWRKLLEYLGKTEADDTPLPLETILESNGFRDALWALRAVDGHQGAMRLYACYCARQVLPVFERWLPGDNRPRQAIETAERFVRGEATMEEVVNAWDAAWDVRNAAHAAANAAAYDARAAARAAARVAARAAAYAAANAASAAAYAAWGLARHACAVANKVTWAAASAAAYAAWATLWYPPWSTAWSNAWADLKPEFIRLCRLEGEYGKVKDPPPEKNCSPHPGKGRIDTC